MQAEHEVVTSALSNELEKAEQLIWSTRTQLAKEQANSEDLSMTVLQATAVHQVRLMLCASSANVTFSDLCLFNTRQQQQQSAIFDHHCHSTL